MSETVQTLTQRLNAISGLNPEMEKILRELIIRPSGGGGLNERVTFTMADFTPGEGGTYSVDFESLLTPETVTATFEIETRQTNFLTSWHIHIYDEFGQFVLASRFIAKMIPFTHYTYELTADELPNGGYRITSGVNTFHVELSTHANSTVTWDEISQAICAAFDDETQAVYYTEPYGDPGWSLSGLINPSLDVTLNPGNNTLGQLTYDNNTGIVTCKPYVECSPSAFLGIGTGTGMVNRGATYELSGMVGLHELANESNIDGRSEYGQFPMSAELQIRGRAAGWCVASAITRCGHYFVRCAEDRGFRYYAQFDGSYVREVDTNETLSGYVADIFEQGTGFILTFSPGEWGAGDNFAGLLTLKDRTGAPTSTSLSEIFGSMVFSEIEISMARLGV